MKACLLMVCFLLFVGSMNARIICNEHGDWCDDGFTCCPNKVYRIMCCPLVNAVCCTDTWCCPAGTRCIMEKKWCSYDYQAIFSRRHMIPVNH
ncbi:progranulin-like [Tachypleus tridentatus]|uniref:progranulin-like n=1 Tax=Tachypleus tridentatus TaxID=6853 RepID=UPI003FD4229D